MSDKTLFVVLWILEIIIIGIVWSIMLTGYNDKPQTPPVYLPQDALQDIVIKSLDTTIKVPYTIIQFSIAGNTGMLAAHSINVIYKINNTTYRSFFQIDYDRSIKYNKTEVLK